MASLASCWRRGGAVVLEEVEPPAYEAVMLDKALETGGVIRLVVNGTAREIESRAAGSMSLAEYLREHERLTGVKLSCREAGCGACTVLLSVEGAARVPVNSCVRLLAACDGCEVTTVEGLGSSAEPSRLQTALVESDATQCGFCTPGMACALTHALEQPGATAASLEAAIDGNICRCTGYRRILDAARSCLPDVEDLCSPPKKAPLVSEPVPVSLSRTGGGKNGVEASYFRPRSLAHAAAILRRRPDAELVAANTGAAVRKYYDGTVIDRASKPAPDAYCDVSRVAEMRGATADRWGASATLAEVLAVCRREDGPRFAALAAHLERVANPQVRAVGTVGGNLTLAAQLPAFPTDLGLLLTALGAEAEVLSLAADDDVDDDEPRFFSRESIAEYLRGGGSKNSGSARRVLVAVRLPALGTPEDEIFLSEKVAQRRVNAHACVNVAFFARKGQDGAMTDVALWYGGINAFGPVRATEAERVLEGSRLGDEATLRDAMRALEGTVVRVAATDPDADAKRRLVRVLAFKILLQAASQVRRLPRDLRRAATGGDARMDAISRGQWDAAGASDAGLYPVSQPGVHKLSALSQCCGSAVYTDDLPRRAPTLFGAFVLSTSIGTLQSLDATDCGERCITEADLSSAGFVNAMTDEEGVLTKIGDPVRHAGQRLALVVAATRDRAEDAARRVEVRVENLDRAGLALDIDGAVEQKSFYSSDPGRIQVGDATKAFELPDSRTVRGRASCGHQAHFHLEQQTCLAYVDGDVSVRVEVASQEVATVASTVAKVLNTRSADVEVVSRRSGGAYGGKASRSVPASCAAAVAAYLCKAAVSIALPLVDNMQMLGSRRPHQFEFKAAVGPGGDIRAVTGVVYADQGCASDFGALTSALDVVVCLDGPYRIPNWDVEGYCCQTNTPSNTYCRGPVFLPGHVLIEAVVEAAADALKLPASFVRRRNAYRPGDVGLDGFAMTHCTLGECISEAMRRSDFDRLDADVAAFNAANRYVKRGLALAPLKYAMSAAAGYAARVSVRPDGSVLVEQSGSELGQGLFVKQVQVAAQTLGCGMDRVAVAPVSSRVSTLPTGGSTTSEGNCASVRLACEKIDAALRQTASPSSASWTRKVATYFEQRPLERRLSAEATYTGDQVEPGILPGATSSTSAYPVQYECFAAAVSLVEYDALSAQPPAVLKTVLVCDQGTSLNPNIDLGQAQGAFTMGLGYLTSEEFRYDAHGRLTTLGTWDYKPPTSRDIPVDFDVAFLPNKPNAAGIYSSKAVGEPAVLAATSVLSAIRHAVLALRRQDGRSSLGGAHNLLLQSPATPCAIVDAVDLDWRRFSYS